MKKLENKTMEPWQKEIKRLDKMRLELGLNFNKLELLTSINRGQLKKIFSLQTIPSLKLYLEIDNALVSQMEVVFNQKSEVVASEVNTENESTITCDCSLQNGLLKRGKIKCKLTKAEHKF